MSLHSRTQQARTSDTENWDSADGFIGTSQRFLAARERIRRITETDATVLIEGERGTGKELAARVIHYQGARRSGPFIPLNCGAIADSLLESELFGHRTADAREVSAGVLLLANGGTLFLDEIDALSARAQVVLLHFLQDRMVRSLEGGPERRIDTRIICATSRSLEQLVRQQTFRQDLFYRLNVMYVELPPLRARPEDIELYAERCLGLLSQRYGLPKPRLDAESAQWLRAQAWPGNVRQLESLLERELLLAQGLSVLRLSTLPGELGPRSVLAQRAEDWNYQQAKARIVEQFDRDFLGKLMSFTHGNVTLAARVANKERRDLGRLLQKYGISPQAFRRPRQ